jgi:NAD(P)-dependent dehydrogenase (short-subunit alcohol dehydrogenase family)
MSTAPSPAAVGVRVVGDGALAPALRAALEDAGTVAPGVAAACVVPAVPAPAPLAAWTDARLATEVGDVLDAVLADVRGELDRLRGGGRLVVVLPHTPLMAAPGLAAASAVTNGVLSMARTLAIELGRDAITVNVVALDAADPAVPALAGGLAGLLGPGGEAVTGQEIYLTAGTDLGRLRP